MEKYFWREKNADLFLGENQVIEPSKEELEQELVKKFSQKLSRCDMIFDQEARTKYLNKIQKSKTDKLEKLTEEEAKIKITLNILVDFMQLTRDICLFYSIDFYDLDAETRDLEFKTIINNISAAIKSLEKRKNIRHSIGNIYSSALSLAKLFDIPLEEIEDLRKAKEEKEGNFYNGKYVIK